MADIAKIIEEIKVEENFTVEKIEEFKDEGCTLFK